MARRRQPRGPRASFSPGGEGKRLMPLTADRAKPAVPFGGNYRLVDFVLSNLVNAGLPADLRAHAVQVALAGPAHHHDLADVDAARQLRHPGAGAAAARPALVHRQRRRDLPEPQPRLRRAARPRRGLRRRPRLPDGPAQMVDAAHRVRRRRHRRRHPGAARARPTSSASSTTAPDGTQIAAFLEKPADPPGLPDNPDEVVRLDGQLRLHHRGAGRGAAHRRRRRGAPCTTWAATSSRC